MNASVEAPIALRKKSLPVLTNSALRSWRACQRKYRFRYVDGYEPVGKSENLAFGSLIHLMLEWWWLWLGGSLRSQFETPLHAALDVLRTSELDPFANARAEAMVRGYHARWFDWASTVKVLGVEAEFRMPLVNPITGRSSRLFQLGGKEDLLVQLEDGTIAIVEHKSSSEDLTAGSTYRSRLLMDGQVSAYFAGAEAMGHLPTLCIFDVLGKPKLRPLRQDKAAPETPGEYRERCIDAIASDPDRYLVHIEVVRLHSEREEWAQEVWQQAQAIQSAKLANAFVRNVDACFNYGRPCEFYGICAGMERVTDATKFKKLENPNVELSNV